MKVNINQIKPNPNNPRYIRDAKFKKLKKSIKEFPRMLELRPIVVDDDMVVLGGNMRLKAITELGIKEVDVIKASDLTEKQKDEFIIKDNVGFGEWDWDMLANEWDKSLLDEWGMDVPYTDDDIEEMNNPINEQSEKPFATELDTQSNYLILKFDTDIDWIQAKTLFGLITETAKRANGKAWSQGIGRVINGTEAINKIQNEN
jgi:ParB-like chromosome segregation protein Spo0J|tara:strand:+ start:190 stop:798 length:609 start_codon:yes stop_codon:yes gene_type:complete